MSSDQGPKVGQMLKWGLLAALIVCGSGCGVVLMVAGSVVSISGADFEDQCEAALGRPSGRANSTGGGVPPGGSSPTGLSVIPPTNPYAELTIAADDKIVSDRHRACVSAMRSAPRQLPPLQKANAGAAAACAARLAVGDSPLALVRLRVVEGAGTVDGPTAGAFGPAAAVRYVVYQASVASATGRCVEPASTRTGHEDPVPEHTDSSFRRVDSDVVRPGPCGQAWTVDRSGNPVPRVVLLPPTVAEQGVCGQRVDAAAISAGDLVFWGHRNNAPTRVGIAVDRTQLVTGDPTTGTFVLQQITSGGDVRVKRVLAGAGW